MDEYAAKPLTLQKINQAYALVRMADPGLTGQNWRDLALGYLSPAPPDAPSTRGVITVQNHQDYILGLFCYAACDHLRQGRTLAIQNLVVIDLFDAAGAIDVLLRSMADLAQQHDCAYIETALPPLFAADSAARRRLMHWFTPAPNADSPGRLLHVLASDADHSLRRATF